MSNEEPKHLYRFVDGYDSEDRALLLLAFPVLRVTPKGFWIGRGGYSSQAFPREQTEKFVLKSEGGRKRFAYADKQDALHNYRQRKLRQTEWLRARLERAERLRLAASGEFEAPYLWGDGRETWWFASDTKPSAFSLLEGLK